MSAVRFVLVALSAAAVGCAGDAAVDTPDETARLPLYGGTPTGECRWPQVVSLDDACSGVLVHREVVLYAAHCGVAVDEVVYAGQRWAVSQCTAFPGAQPGGTDIAFCRLKTPLPGAPTALVASSCEAAAITPGTPAHIVGFGQSEHETFGTRREAGAVVDAVGAEYAVLGGEAGTCFGDSGGPLFVSLETGGGTAVRVAGVLSSKDSGPCPGGRLYYTNVTPFIAWLEGETGLDLTPCTDAEGGWDPSPDCVDGAASTCEGDLRRPSATCGPPHGAVGAAAVPPPEIDMIVPAEDASLTAPPGQRAPVAFALSPAEARSVREVRVLVADASGEIVWRQVVSLQPWRLRPGWFAPGHYRATLEIEPFAGMVIQRARAFEVLDGSGVDQVSSCAVQPSSGRGAGWGGEIAALAALAVLARRRGRRVTKARRVKSGGGGSVAP